MALPGPVRDFLHDRSVDFGILAAVAIGLLEMLVVIQAMELVEGARAFLRTAPLWLWAIAPAIVGFFVWLKLHDLPASSEVQKIIDDERRASSEFARAERIRRASRR
jgi:hypothetical protein